MTRSPRIYTRQGDDGTTRLGGGRKIAKDDLRVEAYGTVDELNSHLGAALAAGLEADLEAELVAIQRELFVLGSQLSFPVEDREKYAVPVIEQVRVDALERLIDRLEDELEPLKNFILPGGCPGGSQLHLARTVCRRAERQLSALARVEELEAEAMRYLNRLSDALFVMARYENHRKGISETAWKGSGTE